MTIAALIATYQRTAALRAALESLGRQRRRPDQVIVAFSNRDFATRRALPSLAVRAGVNVTQVSVGALDVVAKENAGIQAARTDIVCFLDDDVVAPEDWLERIEAHYRDPSVGAVGGPDVLPDPEPTPGPLPIGRLDALGRIFGNHHRPHGDRVLDVHFLKGCNMSFRRELLAPIDARLVGEVEYGFEIDMGLAARALGARVVYDPTLVVEHNSRHDMSPARPDLAFITNHNHTYIVLKRVSWPRKAIFLAYTFLVGDRATAGLLRIAWMKLRHNWALASCTAHLSGKVAGIRSFIKWRKARKPPLPSGERVGVRGAESNIRGGTLSGGS
jgi:GT2 family glycosyltransferase